jgi:hypothetical protein
MAYQSDHNRSELETTRNQMMGSLGLAEATTLFGGDAALQQWAAKLSTKWAKRKNKPAKEFETELNRSWKETLDKAAARRKGAFLKEHGIPAIIQAWKTRQEQKMDFDTLEKSKWLGNFRPPPASSVQLVPTPLVKDDNKKPAYVAPLVAAFMEKLLKLYPNVDADTYPTHGAGPFFRRGFSIDLWLERSPKDARGFWQPQDSVDLLRAVHHAARAVGAEWQVLYNDYSVGRVINQETGARHVIVFGFHGPYPLLLHFHLDLAPLPRVVADSTPGLPPILSQSGTLPPEVVSRILAGDRDVNTLTNSVFYARHPERQGQPLRREEDQFATLSREWLEIRDRFVRPALQTNPMPAQSIPIATQPVSANLDTPQGPFATLTAMIIGRPPFQYVFTPEDALWTARFITGEAGGKDNPDNRAVIWAMFNRYALFTYKHYSTFHQFIRAYSTPLQPVLKSWGAAKRHMHKPQFFQTGGYYDPPHNDIPKGQLRQFLKLQATPWSQLSEGARSLSERALKGQVPNPIGLATEFDSTYVYFHDNYDRYPTEDEWRQYTKAYASKKGLVWIGPIPSLNQMKNAYFIRRRVVGLPTSAVHILPPS